MVQVGDIIEITSSSFKEKKIPLLGRRYEVKEINPSSTATSPALKATPLNYEYTDKKGKFFPTSPLYTMQANGNTWESSGLTHKGRTRAVPANSYKVVQSSGTTAPPSTPTPNTPPPSGSSPIFGGLGTTSDESEKEEVEVVEEVDETPVPDMTPTPTLTVEEQVAVASKLFQTIANRSNMNFEPFPNDREIDYTKFSNFRITLDEDNAKGLSVRLIFSTPIDDIDPATTYGDEKGFWKQATIARRGLVRQYTIGEAVEDVVNRSSKVSPLQLFRNKKKWNEGGKVKSIIIDFAPSEFGQESVPEVAESSSTPESESDEISPREDKEGFEGLGSLFGAEDMEGLNTYPRITVNLIADDGEEFQLTHTYQGSIAFAFPEKEVEKEESVSSFQGFGGLKATSAMVGGGETDTSPEDSSSSASLKWDDIIKIPNYNPASNLFPSTEKGAGESNYEIRAVLGIDFNHDHPIFRPYEKPYIVDWDNAPSIMATGATGYIEAVFTVYSPNYPEGSVTDRLPGFNGEPNPPYNDDWMLYPRKVSVILPSADSKNMIIPSDSGDFLDTCQEIKFFEHKKKFRDIQLIQKVSKQELNPTTFQREEVTKFLTATWKVGEDYEFTTTPLVGKKPQTFKGELTGLIVNPNESREPVFNSAEQARRDRRLNATKLTDTSDIFFGKDETNPNTFVIVLKNETETDYSGQIIRINLGGGDNE